MADVLRTYTVLAPIVVGLLIGIALVGDPNPILNTIGIIAWLLCLPAFFIALLFLHDHTNRKD